MIKSALLAIDTAGPRLQLALVLDGVVDVLVEDVARGHAEILFDRIATLLARHHLTYQHLSRLAVTTGPGSFTGLRIGLSAARGLGLALSIPVIGVPTLTAMSLASQGNGPLAVIVDARRDEAWFNLFDGPGKPQGAAKAVPGVGAHAMVPEGFAILEPDAADIAGMARFALELDPAQYPPDPAYIRDADAKPQTKARVALKDTGS